MICDLGKFAWGVKRIDHGANLTILENLASALRCLPDSNIHHGAGQVVSPYHLIGEQHTQRGVDPAQHASSLLNWIRLCIHY